MLKTGKTERADLYKDRNTQVFLSKLLSGEVVELEPVYDPKVGYRYPLVEAILGAASGAHDFLTKLHDAGVLKRRLYDKIIYCPKCGSANISARYCCPYCHSFDIQKSSLIEHVKCGYMDVEENFHKEGNLVCPKCHDELKRPDVDYRRAGIWCTCKECSKSFDIPIPAHFCRDCNLNSNFEDAVIKSVYAYSLKEEVKQEVSLDWVVIQPIRDFLRDNGFEVESPAFLKGKSGANHIFDIAAFERTIARKVTVIDLATSTENTVLEQPIIALFAKIYDVSPDRSFLIAIPALSEDGKKMGELYNIQIIEAKTQKEVLKALKEKMSEKSSLEDQGHH